MVASSRPDSWPHLPVEIIQHILELIWCSPDVTRDDRTTLLQSLPLVNKSVMVIFNRLSIQDVHLTSSDHAYHYLHTLATRTKAQAAEEASLPRLTTPYPAEANALCRSITFHIPAPPATSLEGGAVQIYSENDPMGQALTSTLATINACTHVPGLERVAVVYSDWGYNDIFDHDRLLYMPQSVRTLELRYAFNAGTDGRIIQGLNKRYFGRPRSRHSLMVGVRTLVLAGACLDFVLDTVQVCPEVEVLEIDVVRKLNVLAPLPPMVHTLVLRAPSGFVLDEEALQSMQLERALKSRVFDRLQRSRIVMDISAADAYVLQHVKDLCETHNVEFAHRLR